MAEYSVTKVIKVTIVLALRHQKNVETANLKKINSFFISLFSVK